MAPLDNPIADPGSFVPVDDGLTSSDPLSFPDYTELRAAARERAGQDESVVAGPATIGGIEVELASFDFGFLGGSMGEVAGERMARALERAADRRVPFVLRTATGGARMQEGMAALVQMPKVVLARKAFASTGLPYIAVLGHPTTGGVLASIGALADITVAETDATIGFAGPRVAEAFTGRPLEGPSHTAVSASRHGLVDEVVPTSEVRPFIANALGVLAPDEPASADEPKLVTKRPDADPWDLVSAVRDASRPDAQEIARAIGDPMVPLRGDRSGSDDPALSACITRIRGRRSVVLSLVRAFAPGPGAYRKARRCIRLAEHLGLPVITLVDTRGADPSSGSENSGIAWEIAATFEALLSTPVPTVSVVTGEGGSGGALAFAVTDALLAMETSIFSVIGPEGAAQILWRESARAPDAARLLRLSSTDLVDLGIADALLPDIEGPTGVADALAYHLDRLRGLGEERRLQLRHERWRRRI